MNAYLILEDGTIFTGKSAGSTKEVITEIVFNTSMTGYLEVLTDPSYAGQGVVMTYPLIGNYGVCYQDMESKQAWVDAYIVKELSRIPSNFRSNCTIQEFLEKQDITTITGVDTRALTKILREKGTMRGMVTTNSNYNLEEVTTRIKEYKVGDVVSKVTCKEAYTTGSGKYKVALMDFGTKKNIVNSLVERGCEVNVFPAHTSAKEIMAINPDGIMLTNGPGDPETNVDIIEEVKKIYQSDIPVFAICLGHQLMALSQGLTTSKMKYGHRGGNHPVINHETGKVYISSQNHGYMVNTEDVDATKVRPLFSNVNDKTNEGLRYTGKDIFTVQFHPEACPGPEDTSYLFDEFITIMGGRK